MHDYPQEKHTHIIFHLSNGNELHFSDTRRFGRFWYIQSHEADTYSGISAKACSSRPANSLTGCEWERLSAAISECMAFFIEKNAITQEEYLETKGQDYRNTPFLQVYGHDGESCPVCGEILCRTVIGGRSSVYCPGCQGNLP